MKGTLETKQGLQITVYVGTATDPETERGKFELLTSASSAPIIRNIETGAQWSMTWKQILDLAIEEGIDS